MPTVTLEAELIPDGTTCRKPTGTTPYVLRRKLPIYGPNRDSAQVYVPPNMMFLVGDRGEMYIVHESAKLSVDCESVADAIEFLQGIEPEDK